MLCGLLREREGEARPGRAEERAAAWAAGAGRKETGQEGKMWAAGERGGSGPVLG